MRPVWKAFKADILPSLSRFSRAFYEASDSNAHKRASPVKPGMHVYCMPPTELCYALGLTKSGSVNLGPFRVESVSKGNARLIGSDGYTSIPVSFIKLFCTPEYDGLLRSIHFHGALRDVSDAEYLLPAEN